MKVTVVVKPSVWICGQNDPSSSPATGTCTGLVLVPVAPCFCLHPDIQPYVSVHFSVHFFFPSLCQMVSGVLIKWLNAAIRFVRRKPLMFPESAARLLLRVHQYTFSGQYVCLFIFNYHIHSVWMHFAFSSKVNMRYISAEVDTTS